MTDPLRAAALTPDEERQFRSWGHYHDNEIERIWATLDATRDALAADTAPLDVERLEAILPDALAEADSEGSDRDDWLGSEYVMRLAAAIARLADTP